MPICKECEEEIIWAETLSGRNVAYNPPLKPGDRISMKTYVIINGKSRPATTDDRRLARDLHTCHFDTCTSRK